MQKVGNTTDTADANGEYTNGNVAQGIPPTIINAEMLNTIQRELVNVVEGADIALDPESYDQLLLSIKNLIAKEIGNKYAKITGDINQKFWVQSAPGDINSAAPVSLLNSELQKKAALNGNSAQKFKVMGVTDDNEAAVAMWQLVNGLNDKANLKGDANVDFYVRNNGDETAAVNNERLSFVLGGYVPKSQFQSGNNGNGSWTKIAGGGQWCRQNINLNANSNNTWTFPASFPGTPGIYITSFNGEFKCWLNGAGPSDCSIYNSGPALNVNVFAIW